MRQLLLLIALYVPIQAQACEWKVTVLDRITNEFKYYLANSSVRTEFVITTSEGEHFAVCAASLQPEEIKEAHKKLIKDIETGLLMCAYVEEPSYPIAASASRFVFTNKPEENNTAIMSLFSVPDKGQKLKPLFTIAYTCEG